MTNRTPHALAAAIALSLALGACGTNPRNHGLESVNQPVVERHNFALDLAAAPDGLPVAEQRRLAGWFDSLDLRYGDRIAVDGPLGGGARRDISGIAGRYGLLLSEGAPVTQGYLQPGTVRVVVSRSSASVPNCPNWSDHFNVPFDTTTSQGYGCAVNSNIAAMVADPEHLLHGAQGTGETVVMSSTKAIATYRAQDPTGKGGLPKVSSQSGSGGGGS